MDGGFIEPVLNGSFDCVENGVAVGEFVRVDF